MLSQSPEPAGLSVLADNSLTRRHTQPPAYQHRPAMPPLQCWDAASPMTPSPCQPAATYIKRELMQLPSNALDENRSSEDVWTYVSPSNVSTVNYYAPADRKHILFMRNRFIFILNSQQIFDNNNNIIFITYVGT